MSNLLTVDQYRLKGRLYLVDRTAIIGGGQEGVVLAHPRDDDLCVKIYLPGEPGDKDALAVAKYRSRKVEAICGLGLTLPQQFTLPQLPVYEVGGSQAIGFQMQRIPAGYHKLLMLADGDFRASEQVGLHTTVELFADIFDDLKLLHGRGLRVGDINGGSVLFRPDGARAWVDTDSWSYPPQFPCLAISVRFAHPDLYSNVKGKSFIPPEPHHDRFAFLVLFTMMAIPGSHPFGTGKHATVHGVQNRTVAGITCFDSDVKPPQVFSSPELLSDELLDELLARLKRRTEAPLDPELLRTFAAEVVTCNKCGAEYHKSRRHCPSCHEMTLTQIAVVNFIVEELFRTKGTLLFAQTIGTDLYLACRTDKGVQIVRIDEHGTSTHLSPSLPNVPGARYRFFGDCLVVCPDPDEPGHTMLELYRVDGGTLQRLDSTSTGVLAGGTAVFDTSRRFLYRTSGNVLMRTSLFGPRDMLFDTPVTDVYQHQSWFTVDHTTGADREVIFGYDRALGAWDWFIVMGRASDNRYHHMKVGDLGVRAGEVIEDFSVHFSASSVLLVMQTSYRGHDYARYAVIGLDGTIHINRLVEADDDTFSYWSVVSGKLHQGRSVLHIASDGIVKQQFSDGSCSQLTGTAGVVSMGDRLIRLGGRVGIVRRGGVLTMTPWKQGSA